jgi:hypothetical protein
MQAFAVSTPVGREPYTKLRTALPLASARSSSLLSGAQVIAPACLLAPINTCHRTSVQLPTLSVQILVKAGI